MYNKSVKPFLRASIMNKCESRSGRIKPVGKSERVSVGGKAKTRGWEEEEGETSQVSHRHRWQRWKERG